MAWSKRRWPIPLVSFGVPISELGLVPGLPTRPKGLRLGLSLDDIEYAHELEPLKQCSTLERLTFGMPYASVGNDWPVWPGELASLLPQIKEVSWILEGGEAVVRTVERRFDTLELIASDADFTVNLRAFRPPVTDKVVSGAAADAIAKRLKGFRLAR
ncbi:MAG: hypothetical protein Q8L48_31835 [Archangium sp.]|nr:hypothetical protein [Archangium sp.]